MFTSKELAEFMGIKTQSVHKMRMQGRGPSYIKAAKLVLYPRAAVVEWLERHSHDTKPPTPSPTPEPTPAPRVFGLRCPKCHGQNFRVTHTRPGAEAIDRYRECRDCHQKWKTTEKCELET